MTKKSNEEAHVIYQFVKDELSRLAGVSVTDQWLHVIEVPAPYDWHFYARTSTSGFWALSDNKATEIQQKFPGRWSILLVDGNVQTNDVTYEGGKVILRRIYNILPHQYDEKRSLWKIVGNEFRINDGEKDLSGIPPFSTLNDMMETFADKSFKITLTSEGVVAEPSRNSEEIMSDFRESLQTDVAKQQLKKIQNEKIEVKEMMKKLDSMDTSSPEFTELVLYGLLPYAKTRKAKRVSTFPVFFDIKQFFEGYRYDESDWSTIAKMVYSLASKFQKEPLKLSQWINEFVSDRLHSRSLQSGSITPILFCINDAYPLINNRIIRTYNEFSRKLGWRDAMSQKLEDYINNMEKCSKLIKHLDESLFVDLAVFDLFCWWYDLTYRHRKSVAAQKDEPEYGLVERVQTREIDYQRFLESLELESVTKFEPHKLRNPDTISVREIVTQCSTGKWLLPKFQRYFDWEKGHVKDFLNSIFNDYYVGSLLLWTVENEPEVETMQISGIMLAGDESRIDAIILDGQQRITSLYYAIRAPDIRLEGSAKPVYFYIDFQNFLSAGDSKDNIAALNVRLGREESFRRLLFPFDELEDYRKWVNDLQTFMRKSSPQSLDKILMVRQIIDDKLNHFLNGFVIPYVSLPPSMKIDQVTDIFEKINSTGMALDVFDLLIARLSKFDIELRDLWEESIVTYPKLSDFKNSKKMPIYILQAISLCFHKASSCKREDILNIHKNVVHDKETSFQELWKEMSGFMSMAVCKLENLRDGFGVKDNSTLPFSPMIPILAALMKEIQSLENKAECNEKLGKWYWAAVFSNAYSSAVESQLTADFRELKLWFTDDRKVPRTVDEAKYALAKLDLKSIQKTSSAIYRGVLSLLALEGARDFDTGRTLENARTNDKHHIFPKSSFKQHPFVNSILNITWMSNDTNRIVIGAKRPSIYAKEFVNSKYGGDQQKFIELLQTHMISGKAYECLLKDDLEAFLNAREKEIIDRINKAVGIETPHNQTTMIVPENPFSNEMAYRDSVSSCVGYLYWADKYFSVKGLRILAAAVDRVNVKEIRILMSNAKVTDDFRMLFKDFRDEMKISGISCSLRVMIDPKLKASIHDRWIISSTKTFNLPSPDVIARGQYSEIKETSNIPPFEEWWKRSLDILDGWNDIQKSLGIR